MMHHYTKFGYKKFNSLKYIIWTISVEILNLCCDLNLENSNSVSSHDTLAVDDTPYTFN